MPIPISIPTVPLSAATQNPPIVVLVEDDACIRDLIEMALRSHGYLVFSCSDSLLAMEMVRSLPGAPSLLVTDIHLGKLAGPDLARQMRAAYPDVKVLFISGYHNANAQVKSARAFPNAGFMRKPFSLHDFREHVHSILQPIAC